MPISGADVMDVVAAAMVSDRKQYNQLLKELLETIEDSENDLFRQNKDYDSGQCTWRFKLYKNNRRPWRIIVIDDLCMGRQVFWGPGRGA